MLLAAAQPDEGKSGKKARFKDYPRAKPAVGQDAPDFALDDLDGKAYRLRDRVGKRPVVIEFGSFT